MLKESQVPKFNYQKLSYMGFLSPFYMAVAWPLSVNLNPSYTQCLLSFEMLSLMSYALCCSWWFPQVVWMWVKCILDLKSSFLNCIGSGCVWSSFVYMTSWTHALQLMLPDSTVEIVFYGSVFLLHFRWFYNYLV